MNLDGILGRLMCATAGFGLGLIYSIYTEIFSGPIVIGQFSQARFAVFVVSTVMAVLGTAVVVIVGVQRR